MQRVDSYDNAYLAAWEANATQRMGFNVHVLSTRTRPTLWLVADVTPRTALSVPYVGVDLSLSPENLEGLTKLQAASDATPASARSDQLVSLTGLFLYPSASPPALGFTMFSTVFDDDPTRVVLASGLLLDQFLDDVIAKSVDGVVVRVTDHLNLSTMTNGCDIDNADYVLQSTVNVTPSHSWRVEIGQCPAYTRAVTAKSNRWVSLYIYLAVICVLTALAVAGLLAGVYTHEKEMNLNIRVAKEKENANAHRWVIGYGECSPFIFCSLFLFCSCGCICYAAVAGRTCAVSVAVLSGYLTSL
jgi:hypothetical protein